MKRPRFSLYSHFGYVFVVPSNHFAHHLRLEVSQGENLRLSTYAVDSPKCGSVARISCGGCVRRVTMRRCRFGKLRATKSRALWNATLVLIVAANIDLRARIARQLQTWGFAVELASDDGRALRLVGECERQSWRLGRLGSTCH